MEQNARDSPVRQLLTVREQGIKVLTLDLEVSEGCGLGGSLLLFLEEASVRQGASGKNHSTSKSTGSSLCRSFLEFWLNVHP